jgi:hypothetical protein
MEAIIFSETSVHIRTTGRNIPEVATFVTIAMRTSNPTIDYMLRKKLEKKKQTKQEGSTKVSNNLQNPTNSPPPPRSPVHIKLEVG